MNIDNLALEDPFDEKIERSPGADAGESKHWRLAAVVFGSALALYALLAYGIYVLLSAL